jgi:hypothetical protein
MRTTDIEKAVTHYNQVRNIKECALEFCVNEWRAIMGLRHRSRNRTFGRLLRAVVEFQREHPELASGIGDIMETSVLKWICANDLAMLVGMHRQGIARMCRDGRLPGAWKDGRRWIVPIDAALSLLAKEPPKLKTKTLAAIAAEDRR